MIRQSDPTAPGDAEIRAAEAFVRKVLSPEPGAQDSSQFSAPPTKSDNMATNKVERLWRGLQEHAGNPALVTMHVDALMQLREAQAARKSNTRLRSTRFWLAAAALACVVLLGGLFVMSNRKSGPLEIYETGIGDQRMIELADSSRIALDALTRVTVSVSQTSRVARVMTGQAQFMVAKDPTRPFRVETGNYSVIALGTSFNVEFIDQELHVAMVEGRVAVTNNLAAAGSHNGAAVMVPVGFTELSTGEELFVNRAGKMSITRNADVAASIAWREGKVIFRGETLSSAVDRLNRYSKIQLEIAGPALGSLVVSGVFEAGNTRAFAKAAEGLFPIDADFSNPERIRLTQRLN
jgi:transmembrane sensor